MNESQTLESSKNLTDSSDFLIPLIILLIFIGFFGFLIYLLISSQFVQSPLVQDSEGQTSRITDVPTLPCPVDQCATSLITGLKRCPPPGEQIDSYPAIEVCNSAFLCDNIVTPYAVRSDGSASSSGVCDTIAGLPTTCSCQRRPTCQSYLTSMYQSTGGSASNPLAGQRISFIQVPAFQASGVPNSYTPGSQFCTVPLSWLPLAGCGFVPGGFTNTMDRAALQTCMDLGNACQTGILAAITPNSEKFGTESNDVQEVQYGCVVGTKCPSGKLTVYDTSLGEIVCR